MNDFLNAAISPTCTFVFGYVLWRLERPRKALTHKIALSSNVFNANIGSFEIELENSGNTEVRSLFINVAVPSGKINCSKYDATILTLREKTEQTIRLDAPFLNVKEKLHLTLITESLPQAALEFSARADGTTSVLWADSFMQITNRLLPLFYLFLLILTGVGILYSGYSQILRTDAMIAERVEHAQHR